MSRGQSLSRCARERGRDREPWACRSGIRACLFDLDGVLTQTAKVHAAAWKEMFDAYLRARSSGRASAFVPFDPHHDYDRYVDGMPRYDGVRSFLASREHRASRGRSERPARRGDGLRPREPEERARAGADPRAGRRGVRRARSSYVHAARDAGLRARRRLVERELQGRARGGRASTTCSTRSSTGSSRASRT